ncbi:MAG TPA: signal recognition particle-docking protein FtsY [Acidimicrobiales bacterium]|nr:signal recognition particle-docking protein FtsY [Acidimicrobiales bacterium]
MSHGVLWLLIAVAVVVLATATVGLVRVRRRRSIESGRPPTLEAAPEPAPVTAPPVPPSATTSVDAEAVDAPRAVAPEVAAPAALSVRLGSARSLFDRVRALRGRTAIGTDELAEVEAALLRADVGTATTASILEAITTAAADRTLGDDGVTGALRRELLAVLGPAPAPLSAKVDADRVAVWLFVGVNGVGKTTTIGKVAAMESKEIAVLLAAGDTFRAAAADQLETWATRVGCELVRAEEGADPGAVVHDALHRAASKGIPLVLADTAGRLHNKANLLEELRKVRRVADRAPGQVAEVLLVLDATTGQNAIAQAREFSEAVGVTGIVLTKLDGTARGGVVLAVQRELGIPVRLVGVGEQLEDLVAFDPVAFVDALLDD